MEDKTSLAVLFLALLTIGNCQSHLPVYEAEGEEPLDKQFAALGSLVYNLIQPTFSNILAAFTTNLGSAIQNAFTATLGGKQLEMITLDSLAPLKEFTAPAAHSAAHPNALSGEPPKRRPYTRSMTHDDKPLLDSEPKTSSSP